MKYTLTGKNLEVSEALALHVRAGVERIAAQRGDFEKIDTVLRVQKGDHIVEMDVYSHPYHIYAKSSSNDMYASIDTTLARLERQLEKLHSSHH